MIMGRSVSAGFAIYQTQNVILNCYDEMYVRQTISALNETNTIVSDSMHFIQLLK